MKTLVMLLLGFTLSNGPSLGAEQKDAGNFSRVGELQRITGLAVSDTAQKGVVVRRIIENSPAARSGIEVGDIIKKVENVSVESTLSFYEEISNHAKIVEMLIEEKGTDGLLSFIYLDLSDVGSSPVPSHIKFTKIKSRWQSGRGSYLHLKMIRMPCSSTNSIELYEFDSVFDHEFESSGRLELNCKTGHVSIDTNFGGFYEGLISDDLSKLFWFDIEFPRPLGFRDIVWR